MSDEMMVLGLDVENRSIDEIMEDIQGIINPAEMLECRKHALKDGQIYIIALLNGVLTVHYSNGYVSIIYSISGGRSKSRTIHDFFMSSLKVKKVVQSGRFVK